MNESYILHVQSIPDKRTQEFNGTKFSSAYNTNSMTLHNSNSSLCSLVHLPLKLTIKSSQLNSYAWVTVLYLSIQQPALLLL